jgi:hypothetical protein
VSLLNAKDSERSEISSSKSAYKSLLQIDPSYSPHPYGYRYTAPFSTEFSTLLKARARDQENI